MTSILSYGVATVASTTSQVLLARRAGFSAGENLVYNTASVITTFVASKWLSNSMDRYYEKSIGFPASNGNYDAAKEKVDKTRGERRWRDVSIILLQSHCLGWVAGSLASALFKYHPQHMGAAAMINTAAFGIQALVLLSAWE